MKTFSKRFSFSYHSKYSDAFSGVGAFGIPLCIGPLAKSTEDLALWFKVATNENFYQGEIDPYIKNVPFNDEKYLKSG